MSADIRDAEDAFLEAKSQVDEWSAEFLAAWFKPYNEQTAAMLWMSLPENVKQAMLQKNPEAAGKVKEIADRYAKGIQNKK